MQASNWWCLRLVYRQAKLNHWWPMSYDGSNFFLVVHSCRNANILRYSAFNILLSQNEIRLARIPKPCLTWKRFIRVLNQSCLIDHAARRSEGGLINNWLLPTPPRTLHRRAGGQLKTWATAIKAHLEPISGPPVFGYARWRKHWLKVSRRTIEPGVPHPRRG